MNMIEKVARAMHEDVNWCSWDALPDECSCYGVGRNERKREAKVAIEAMREPTLEMVVACDNIINAESSAPFKGGIIRRGYDAMINKALEQ